MAQIKASQITTNLNAGMDAKDAKAKTHTEELWKPKDILVSFNPLFMANPFGYPARYTPIEDPPHHSIHNESVVENRSTRSEGHHIQSSPTVGHEENRVYNMRILHDTIHNNDRRTPRPSPFRRQSSEYYPQSPAAHREIKLAVQAAPWIAFDLDSVLHDYLHAATLAACSVLRYLEKTYNLEVPITSSRILVGSGDGNGTFPDGRISYECEQHRYIKLLNKLQVKPTTELIQKISELFNNGLAEHVKPRSGAQSLVQTLKRMGKMVAVITDGDQEVQERTLEMLGLIDHIDYLGTSSAFRHLRSKNIFRNVLDFLQIEARDMLYVGYSKKRHIEPARELGIFVILFADEIQRYSWDKPTPKITSFGEFEAMITKQDSNAGERMLSGNSMKRN